MRYDTTLKALFQAPPQQLLYLLVGGQAQALLTVEYPSVRLRRPDLVVRLTDGRLFHLELQSDNDATMPWRMLDYYSLLRQHYGQAPHQQVLYVGEAPMTLKARIEESRLTFDYEVRDIRTLDGASLLASPVLEDNLLALLCGAGDTRQTVQHILTRIGALPHSAARTDALVTLLILAGLRHIQHIVREEATQMALTLDIRTNPFLREVLEEGHQEGEKTLLRRQLERRFGLLPEWAHAQITAADTATVEQWGLRLLEARSLEEVLRAP